jgi:hypothetical protein
MSNFFDFKKNVIFFTSIFQLFILFAMVFILYTKKNVFISSFIYGGLTSFFSSHLISFFIKKKTSIKKKLQNFYLAIFLKTCFFLLFLTIFLKIGIKSPFHFFISFIIIQVFFWLGCLLYFFLYEDVNFYERK